MNAGTGNINWWRTLGWAFYLACSWTWCIGMFLPVLLVRDYGVWGFVAFAVPNVIGAAAMGWVLREPGMSERILGKHRVACACFSWITITFQLFWLTQMRPWMPVGMLSALGGWWVLIGLGLVLSIAAMDMRWRIVGIASAGVWLISATAWTQVSGVDVVTDGFWAQRPELIWLVPVMMFGFALCPYLDVSFHRARQAAPGVEGTAAFTIGFGLLFAAMILFTLWYSGFLLQLPAGRPGEARANALSVHWGVQTLFTMAAHLTPLAIALEALKREGRVAELGKARVHAKWLVAAVCGVGIASAMFLPGFDLSRLSISEIVYRCFMAFYGLVFPAYVWLLMIPTRDGHAGLGGANGRRKLLIWAVAVGLAAPMFWMGFIRQQEFWLAPGLGIVIGARAFLPRSLLPRPA